MKVINTPMYESDRGCIYKTKKEALEDDVLFYADIIVGKFNLDLENKVSKDDLLDMLCSNNNLNIIANLARAHNKLKEVNKYDIVDELVNDLCEETDNE